MMRKPVTAIFVAIVWVLAMALSASTAPASAKPARPLFASSELIHLTIKAPMGALTQDPARPNKPVAGTLTVVGGTPDTLAITLTPRGLTRRRPETCPFPPLRVEFPDKPPAGSLFEGQKKLKLVTHCQTANGFQQFVLLEYAAYRMYNVLTPTGFAVRLAMIDYVYPDGHPMVSRLGFFLEPAGDMAKRNDLRDLNLPTPVHSAQLSAHDSARFALFEDMIGNLDWSMIAGPAGSDCCHNTRLLGPEGATDNLVPVPYDFDYSGLVDAPYAVPPTAAKLSNVRERYYNGFCKHNVEIPAVAAEFLAKRAQLLAVLDAIPQLDDGRHRKAAAYLEAFFDQLATPASIDAKLLKTCGKNG
jgi:hypothetical protein